VFFATEREALNVARTEARALFQRTGTKPKVLSAENAATFWGELGYAFRLVLEEKEIIVFAVLQWVVIAAFYMIWTRVLDWIPDSVWQEIARSTNDDIAFTFLNLFLLGWSFLVVAVASYPISLLNAAMTAAHYLRNAGQASTVHRCLELAARNLGRLWVFTTIDAWITVNAIIDRLPRKRNNRTPLDELLYYAWKIGTIGVVPALVAGKGYLEAAKDSVSLLTAKPLRAIGIRMGYSLMCWIIGVSAYAGAAWWFMTMDDDVGGKANGIYEFYVLMAVPIVIAVGATTVLIRPFYLVTVSRFYTDVIPVAHDLTSPAAGKGSRMLGVTFAVLLGTLMALYFFGDALGVAGWIERLAAKDLGRR
jgi:hypothetical protein